MNDTREPPGDRAAVEAARERLAAATDPVDRTETLPASTAVGRVLAAPVTARRPVPHYSTVTADGFAVRAADVADATPDSPTTLGLVEDGSDDAEGPTAVRVDAGDELPEGTDAVVAAGATESTVDASGEAPDLTVEAPVEAGEGVRPAGADVAAGEAVRDAGDRVRPSDPALCAAVGHTRVEAVQRPTVGIVPTGDGLVGGDPADGETVETDGTTLASFVDRWGGKVTRRDPVATDPYALRAAVQRDLTKDLLVTTGGTGGGRRDRVPGVVDELGSVVVDGVALEPGGTARVGVVRERPVVALPGDPVACLVAAVQLLGPAVARLAHRPAPTYPTTDAALAEGVSNEAGARTVLPVELDEGAATPIRSPGADGAGETGGPLSTVARADGWVVVEEGDRAAGETVTVERWEAQA